jgi:hypothetical protein
MPTNPGADLNPVFSDHLQNDRTILAIHDLQCLPDCGSMAFVAGLLNDPLQFCIAFSSEPAIAQVKLKGTFPLSY